MIIPWWRHYMGTHSSLMFPCVVNHYDDVIMSTIASQITSLTIVYSTVYSGADQSKHQSSASLAFVWGIHRGPVNSPHKWPVTRKMFPFDDVIMSTDYRWVPCAESHNKSINWCCRREAPTYILERNFGGFPISGGFFVTNNVLTRCKILHPLVLGDALLGHMCIMQCLYTYHPVTWR